jgi:hypothetical protein
MRKHANMTVRWAAEQANGKAAMGRLYALAALR